MTTDIKKLLPCPFCGSGTKTISAVGEVWVVCVACNSSCGVSTSSVETAHAAWNRRTPELSTQTAVKTEQPSLSDGGGQNVLESAETRANATFVVVGEKTDAQIVDAVNAAFARGRIALTFFNLEGVEKPTDVARSFVRALLSAQRQDSDKAECKCSLRTKLVGDGCEVCNPKLAEELAQDSDKDAELRRVANELRAYSPEGDEYKGKYIHKVWTREIDAAIANGAPK